MKTETKWHVLLPWPLMIYISDAHNPGHILAFSLIPNTINTATYTINVSPLNLHVFLNCFYQLHIFWHYSHPLAMDGTKVCILVETNQI